MANPPASNAALSDAAAAIPAEDGFITLDVTPAAALGLGNTPAYNTGLQGVGGAELHQGNRLTDLLPNTHKPANTAGGNSKAASSADGLAAEVARPAAAILQPATESEEGGSIELAIRTLATATAGDSAPPAGESTVGTAQQLSEIRPESGVGLFCDIEVAIAPTLPMGDSAALARPVRTPVLSSST